MTPVRPVLAQSVVMPNTKTNYKKGTYVLYSIVHVCVCRFINNLNDFWFKYKPTAHIQRMNTVSFVASYLCFYGALSISANRKDHDSHSLDLSPTPTGVFFSFFVFFFFFFFLGGGGWGGALFT